MAAMSNATRGENWRGKALIWSSFSFTFLSSAIVMWSVCSGCFEGLGKLSSNCTDIVWMEWRCARRFFVCAGKGQKAAELLLQHEGGGGRVMTTTASGGRFLWCGGGGDGLLCDMLSLLTRELFYGTAAAAESDVGTRTPLIERAENMRRLIWRRQARRER